MTVQPATRMWSRHDATVTSEKGQKTRVGIREGYQVVCDATDTLIAVLNAPNLPALGDIYPDTLQVRVVGRNPNQVSPIYYIVEIVYEGLLGPDGQPDKPPTEQRPIVRWGKIESDEPVDEDWNGNAIVTENNEPITGVTKKLSDLTVTVTRNYETISLPATYQYLHSVNSDLFLGFAPGVCRMTQFNAEEQYSKINGGYFVVTAGFEFRWPYNTTPERAWWTRLRHEGYLVKTSGGDIQRAKDVTGQDTSQPVLLKSDGTEETDPSLAHWLEFQIYTPLPYNALGLFDG